MKTFVKYAVTETVCSFIISSELIELFAKMQRFQYHEQLGKWEKS